MTDRPGTPPEDDPLSRVFHALADPTRRALLERLGRGDATVTELAEPLPVSRPAVSQHLAVLEAAHLVSRSTRGRFRMCTVDPTGLEAADAWVERQRAAWNARFDVFDEVLHDLRAVADRASADRAAADHPAGDLPAPDDTPTEPTPTAEPTKESP
ncbi:ArsR/SmtB family transcription factor [Brevibacterium litoralis]|uniref:ArsR/SmtB family transcription factor n=1 Tax=Brevibacterium litoralis TaxID=3138935 RepID=UPI0032F080AB